VFLQIALDVATESELVACAEGIRAVGITRVEIGTLTLLNLGVRAVSAVAGLGFDFIYLDTKLVDLTLRTLTADLVDGRVHAFSLHALADNAEVASAVEFASAKELAIYTSTIGMNSRQAVSHARRHWERGVTGVIAHGCGEPGKAFRTSISRLRRMNDAGLPPRAVVLAGGVSTARLAAHLPELPPDLAGVIVGRAVTDAVHPGSEVASLMQLVNNRVATPHVAS
jgi:3-keto-L-gulonate-6-phosphate decarboxylase